MPAMPMCPHCDIFYDDTNDTQPCCGACGHPISCGCLAYDSYGYDGTSSSFRGSTAWDDFDAFGTDTDNASDTSDNDGATDATDDSFAPDDDLPF